MRKKVLIVDDDADVGEMLGDMLQEAGYDIENQRNGYAVQQIQEPLPDLLLLDMWLSGMNGRDICRHLKNQQSTHHLPIILLSAHQDTHQLARDAGADDSIMKPFEMKALLALIAHYIGSGEIDEEKRREA